MDVALQRRIEDGVGHYTRPLHAAATMAAMADDALELLASLSLFADLGGPQLEAISHTFEETTFAAGQRILRQGISGSNFYVVVDGEASVKIDGEERASIGRGDFFGEMSLLLGGAPTADVTARTPLRCLVLAGPDLEGFLATYPSVTYRMLVAMARRLRAANQHSA
jgi:CRP/FNR family cyclic AMP-dependent transcriptional regulator